MAKMLESSAAQRVLALPELVENIQSQLPPRDLLVSQRINSIFHDVFHSRLEFKQLLHLAPSSNTDFKIAPVLPAFIVKAVDVRGDPKQPPHSLAELSMQVNPAIKEGIKESWRAISITSPPAKDVLLYVLSYNPFYPHLLAMPRIRRKHGVTLGDVADATAEYRKHNIGYWYQIRVIKSRLPDPV